MSADAAKEESTSAEAVRRWTAQTVIPSNVGPDWKGDSASVVS
jgi:hypothetical protein